MNHNERQLNPVQPYLTNICNLTFGLSVMIISWRPHGPGSPKISLTDGKADSITFEQTVQWLIRILSTPLSAVLSLIGNDLTSEQGLGLPRTSSSLLISPKSSPKHTSGKHSFRAIVQHKIMNMKCPSCNASLTGRFRLSTPIFLFSLLIFMPY